MLAFCFLSPISSAFLFEKLWKRICAELVTEINLLAANWKYLLAGLVGQVIQFATSLWIWFVMMDDHWNNLPLLYLNVNITNLKDKMKVTS